VIKRVKGRHLNRPKGRREALCRNLMSALLQYGEVRTTEARAKEVQSRVERLITLAKRGDLHARRLVLSRLPNQVAVGRLFSEIAPRYADHSGGYTQLLRLEQRRGDGAQMMLLRLVKSTEGS
jgi:large subunit ribosomal protein L17